eukprot:9502634-Pyramimonas_sp.AAC.1
MGPTARPTPTCPRCPFAFPSQTRSSSRQRPDPKGLAGSWGGSSRTLCPSPSTVNRGHRGSCSPRPWPSDLLLSSPSPTDSTMTRRRHNPGRPWSSWTGVPAGSGSDAPSCAQLKACGSSPCPSEAFETMVHAKVCLAPG